MAQHCSEEFRAFNNCKSELSMLNGCILRGSRVVITTQARNQLLSELHQGRPGINNMKNLARMYIWWPNINKKIERVVKGCTKCQENQSNVPSVLKTLEMAH